MRAKSSSRPSGSGAESSRNRSPASARAGSNGRGRPALLRTSSPRLMSPGGKLVARANDSRRQRSSRDGLATDRSQTSPTRHGDRWPGLPLHELRAHGYNPVQLRLVGHNAIELKSGGYTVQEV